MNRTVTFYALFYDPMAAAWCSLSAEDVVLRQQKSSMEKQHTKAHRQQRLLFSAQTITFLAGFFGK